MLILENKIIKINLKKVHIIMIFIIIDNYNLKLNINNIRLLK